MTDSLDYIQKGLHERIRRDVMAELFRSGGLPQGRLSMELFYLLPDNFMKAYTDLFWRALNEQRPPAPGKDELLNEGKPAGTGGVEHAKPSSRKQGKQSGIALGSENRLQATGGKRYKTYWTVKDEKAFRLKQRVDTKLRELADLIQRSRSESSTITSIKPCGQCGKFMQADWRFCPGCGNNLSINR